MRTLYESILDTDIQVQSDILDRPLQELVELLMLDKSNLFDGSYEIRNGHLYVDGRNKSILYLTVSKGRVTNPRLTDTSRVVDVELFKLVHLDNLQLRLRVDTLETPRFLSNCNNCIIVYEGIRDEAYRNLDKVLSKTKGNQINIWSTKEVCRLIYSYDVISNLNFSNCRVVLYNSADLSTIKNLTARELIIQRGGKFEIDGPIFEADRELSDYFVQKLDEFLARNKITSFGMVDSFVQYIDWFVKKGNDYTYEFLTSNKKRVPRVK